MHRKSKIPLKSVNKMATNHTSSITFCISRILKYINRIATPKWQSGKFLWIEWRPKQTTGRGRIHLFTRNKKQIVVSGLSRSLMLWGLILFYYFFFAVPKPISFTRLATTTHISVKCVFVSLRNDWPYRNNNNNHLNKSTTRNKKLIRMVLEHIRYVITSRTWAQCTAHIDSPMCVCERARYSGGSPPIHANLEEEPAIANNMNS